MHHRRGLQSDDIYALHRTLNIVYRGALGEHPLHHLQVGKRGAILRRVISLVAAVARKEEEACRESLFVYPLGDKLALDNSQAHDAIACHETQAISSCWGVGLQLLTTRNDDILALKLPFGPLDGARLNVAAICGSKRDARTGQ